MKFEYITAHRPDGLQKERISGIALHRSEHTYVQVAMRVARRLPPVASPKRFDRYGLIFREAFVVSQGTLRATHRSLQLDIKSVAVLKERGAEHVVFVRGWHITSYTSQTRTNRLRRRKVTKQSSRNSVASVKRCRAFPRGEVPPRTGGDSTEGMSQPVLRQSNR